MSYEYSEDGLIEQATHDVLEELGWKVVTAWHNESFGKEGSLEGEEIKFTPKNMSVARYLIGGSIFGLGWAMTGACPGPMFILLGKGAWAIGIVIISATFGTFLYGLVRDKLPH